MAKVKRLIQTRSNTSPSRLAVMENIITLCVRQYLQAKRIVVSRIEGAYLWNAVEHF